MTFPCPSDGRPLLQILPRLGAVLHGAEVWGVSGNSRTWDGMMKNKISDLNDHLFAQLERLSDEDMTAEKLANETARARAVSNVARQVIDGARLALDAQRLYDDGQLHEKPAFIEAPRAKLLPVKNG